MFRTFLANAKKALQKNPQSLDFIELIHAFSPIIVPRLPASLLQLSLVQDTVQLLFSKNIAHDKSRLIVK